MARIVEAAWKASNEGGLYVWLSAVKGARRGEVVALQWNDVDLANGILRLDENYVRATDGMILKDTKSHQMRRVSIDKPTVELLRRHKEDCAQRLRLLGSSLGDGTWLFSAQPDLSKPRDPSSVTRRLVSNLGINTHLKEPPPLLGYRAAHRPEWTCEPSPAASATAPPPCVTTQPGSAPPTKKPPTPSALACLGSVTANGQVPLLVVSKLVLVLAEGSSRVRRDSPVQR